MGKVTVTYYDFGLPQEASAVRIPIPDVDEANFVLIDGEIDTLVASIDNITLGVRTKDERSWIVNESPKSQPASQEAQREKKWLVIYHDSVTGQLARMEIPTADLTKIQPGTDGLLDISTPGEPGTVFKAAFQTLVPGPSGNTAVIDYVKFVGRNL